MAIEQPLKERVLNQPQEASSYLEVSEHRRQCRSIGPEVRACLRALELVPANLQVRVLLGQALMRADDYVHGWSLFEDRIQLEPNNGLYLEGLTQLDLVDQSARPRLGELLVVKEMGYGDMLQFVRYGSVLRGLAERLICLVPEALAPLIARAGLFDLVTSSYDVIQPSAAAWIPITSLARAAGASRLQPMRSGRYLTADPDRVSSWRNRIQGDHRWLVVLNWSAQRWSTEKNQPDSRHCPIECFSIFAQIPGVAFCSVQKGESQALWRQCSFSDQFIGSQQEIDASDSYEDTAALLELCDLCITVDTSVAHLSGALGVKTWILLKYAPCWRWGLGRDGLDGSGWYDSAMLAFQDHPGDWTSAVQHAYGDIVAYLNSMSET